MALRWFLSGTVRQATEAVNHVRKLLNAQRDLLSPQAIDGLTVAIDNTRTAIDSNADKAALQKQISDLEKAAAKWLKPYPHSGWRENVEVLLVAIAVAMAIRTFFLQPFKIPTGSMQPTLYGITSENLKLDPSAKIPGAASRFFGAIVGGTFYHELIAKDDCEILFVSPQEHMSRFISKHRIHIQYAGQSQPEVHTVWFTPDERFPDRAGVQAGQRYRKGEPIIKLKEISGDHLFVDRLTYNFRRPQRGEIIVFKTRSINPAIMRQDQFYIKRLVGLGGEKISIGDDRHVRINGERLDASTPRFENVYSFKGEPQDSIYSGHLNGPMLAPLLPGERAYFEIRPDHYFVLGDNTVSSFDSRTWGDFPQRNVIGKSFFVYWPISNHGESRFGWGHR